MKRIIYLTLLLSSLLVSVTNLNGQTTDDKKKIYTTSGGEIIFSWANVKQNGKNADVITRFSPVLNIQVQVHKDLSEHFGLFSGINLRNVGFIWDDPDSVNTRYKARNYTLGVPLALKLGKMKGFFIFGGYEFELPFNYKEKKFVNEDKVEKNTSWFSDKAPGFYQSFFAGFHTPFGTELKFKYYITNFFNKDYVANDGHGGTYKPYANIPANVFYVSLSVQLFHGSHYYHSEQNKV